MLTIFISGTTKSKQVIAQYKAGLIYLQVMWIVELYDDMAP